MLNTGNFARLMCIIALSNQNFEKRLKLTNKGWRVYAGKTPMELPAAKAEEGS